jgi:hypothetical protein
VRIITTNAIGESCSHLVPPDLRDLYHVKEWRNAAGVLTTACPKEWEEIVTILRKFRLLRSEVQAAGKNRSPISKQLDGAFYATGWQEKQFKTAIKLDEIEVESPTHKIDCFKVCAAVTNWAMERRRGAGAGGVKTVQWLG